MIDTLPLKNLAKKLQQNPASQLIELMTRYVTAEELIMAMNFILPFLVTNKRGSNSND
ncbi:MAG: hypothetical protein QXU18_05260 [Thermoplasmatales archaeon]